MNKKVDKALSDIRNTLCHARLCHEAWWIFTGDHPNRSDIIWVHNYYVEFFGAVRPALYVTFVLKIASLFDLGKESISFNSIPDINKLPDYQNVWDRGRRLYRYRSKAIAHRDKNVGEKNFATETGFTYSGFKQLLDDSCNLFNEASSKLGSESIPNFSCSSDLQRLIDDLKMKPSKSS